MFSCRIPSAFMALVSARPMISAAIWKRTRHFSKRTESLCDIRSASLYDTFLRFNISVGSILYDGRQFFEVSVLAARPLVTMRREHEQANRFLGCVQSAGSIFSRELFFAEPLSRYVERLLCFP